MTCGTPRGFGTTSAFSSGSLLFSPMLYPAGGVSSIKEHSLAHDPSSTMTKSLVCDGQRETCEHSSRVCSVQSFPTSVSQSMRWLAAATDTTMDLVSANEYDMAVSPTDEAPSMISCSQCSSSCGVQASDSVISSARRPRFTMWDAVLHEIPCRRVSIVSKGRAIASAPVNCGYCCWYIILGGYMAHTGSNLDLRSRRSSASASIMSLSVIPEASGLEESVGALSVSLDLL